MYRLKKITLCTIPIIIILALSLVGCDMFLGFGERHVDDPAEYGDWDSHLAIPAFLPDSIADYQVNGYSLIQLEYLDTCYEIFLDISVSEEQFQRLIADAKAQDPKVSDRAAYYADGYFEIIFEDLYEAYENERSETDADIERVVGNAHIEKVIYNPEELRIVYVCFHTNDTGVYKISDVQYFNRFSITEEEYVKRYEQTYEF